MDFYRNWQNYKLGFGSVTAEFWLGNEKLSSLFTDSDQYTLRVDLENEVHQWYHAQYSDFYIDGSEENYKLTIGNYTGTAGKDQHNNIHVCR